MKVIVSCSHNYIIFIKHQNKTIFIMRYVATHRLIMVAAPIQQILNDHAVYNQVLEILSHCVERVCMSVLYTRGSITDSIFKKGFKTINTTLLHWVCLNLKYYSFPHISSTLSSCYISSSHSNLSVSAVWIRAAECCVSSVHLTVLSLLVYLELAHSGQLRYSPLRPKAKLHSLFTCWGPQGTSQGPTRALTLG